MKISPVVEKRLQVGIALITVALIGWGVGHGCGSRQASVQSASVANIAPTPEPTAVPTLTPDEDYKTYIVEGSWLYDGEWDKIFKEKLKPLEDKVYRQKDYRVTLADIDEFIEVFNRECLRKGTPINKSNNSNSIAYFYLKFAIQNSNWDKHRDKINELKTKQEQKNYIPVIQKDLKPVEDMLYKAVAWQARSSDFLYNLNSYKGYSEDDRYKTFLAYTKTKSFKGEEGWRHWNSRIIEEMLAVLNNNHLMLHVVK